MDGWLTCPICKYSRESLLATPCCGSYFCNNCLQNKAFCPKCTKIFDLKKCTIHIPLSPIIHNVTYKCPHPGCEKICDKLLLNFHIENCPQRPQHEIDQLNPKYENNEEARLRRLHNIHNSYMKFYVQESASSVPGYFIHVVVPTDTLQGLSIKYGVSIAEIKSENRLISLNLHEKFTLRIPERKKLIPNQTDLAELEAMMQRRLIGRFKKLTSISDMSEALFYLEASEFDLETALKSYHEDSSWETAHPFRSSMTPSCKSEIIKKQKKRKQLCLCIPLAY